MTHGVGLRSAHFEAWARAPAGVDFTECITENFLEVGGRPRRVLEQVRAQVPVVLHGVSMSIGSVDPLDREYLKGVKRLADELDVAWVSDHLCWASVDGHFLHDLLPLPYTEEALDHVASRVDEVQTRLGRRLVLENPSTYLTFADTSLTEPQFMTELCRRTGCAVLLDLNNIYVSSQNHATPVDEWFELPRTAIAQFHLAGHSNLGTHLLDTHDGPVADPVWALYRRAVATFGAVPTLIEWDDRIPSIDDVVAQSRLARDLERAVLGGADADAR
jgi:uncharacterized protein